MWSNISQTLQSSMAVPGPLVPMASSSNIDSTINVVLICLSQIDDEAFMPGWSAMSTSNYVFYNGSWAWSTGELLPEIGNPFSGKLDPRIFDITQVAFFNEPGSDLQAYTLAINGIRYGKLATLTAWASIQLA